jgi:hypothetical protein
MHVRLDELRGHQCGGCDELFHTAGSCSWSLGSAWCRSRNLAGARRCCWHQQTGRRIPGHVADPWRPFAAPAEPISRGGRGTAVPATSCARVKPAHLEPGSRAGQGSSRETAAWSTRLSALSSRSSRPSSSLSTIAPRWVCSLTMVWRNRRSASRQKSSTRRKAARRLGRQGLVLLCAGRPAGD